MTDTCPTPEAEQGDIVGRLRDAAGDGRNLPSTCVVTPDLLLDAASEVERLRSEVERLREPRSMTSSTYFPPTAQRVAELEAEVEHLRSEVEEWKRRAISAERTRTDLREQLEQAKQSHETTWEAMNAYMTERDELREQLEQERAWHDPSPPDPVEGERWTIGDCECGYVIAPHHFDKPCWRCGTFHYAKVDVVPASEVERLRSDLEQSWRRTSHWKNEAARYQEALERIADDDWPETPGTATAFRDLARAALDPQEGE